MGSFLYGDILRVQHYPYESSLWGQSVCKVCVNYSITIIIIPILLLIATIITTPISVIIITIIIFIIIIFISINIIIIIMIVGIVNFRAKRPQR